MKQLKVLELFAGVGGFRVGLEASSPKKYKTLWSNQWEPSKKTQDAFEVYNYHFPDSTNLNTNIEDITDEQFKKMDADLIVGGFPCQDYSVARSKKNELGIEGKKGVLFWQIIRATSIIKPKYLILENVDRLLKSPSTQRGRDFAIMLASFNELGYSVEWRVINSADYGGSQRRRRVFFFVYRNDTPFAVKLEKSNLYKDNYDHYIFESGLFARQFPIKPEPNKKRISKYDLPKDIVDISDNFTGTVWNTGIMRNGTYHSIDTIPLGTERPITLGQILEPLKEVPNKYIISDIERINKFKYLRGAKKINRTSLTGHKYLYSEGSMSEFDSLDLPGRTMLTSEGTLNRSTHLLNIEGTIRLITPIEAERLQSFPDNWTAVKVDSNDNVVPVNPRMRMFFMGNALVTSVIKRIGDELIKVDK